MGKMRQTIDVKIQRPRAGRESIWTILTGFKGESFCQAEVYGLLDSESQKSEARKYIKNLIMGGYIEVSNKRMKLLRSPQKAPRFDRNGHEIITDNQQMWNAMRQLRCFTQRDLMLSASLEHKPIKANTAKKYIRYLELAGFLVRAKNENKYQLKPKKNTGPTAPQVIHVKLVFDQNSEEAVQIGGAS